MRLSTIGFLALTILFSANNYALDANGKFESIQEQDAYIAKTLQDMAVAINRQTPIPASNDTQITSAIAFGKTLNIYVTLLTHNSTHIDTQEFGSIMRKELNDIICKAEPMRAMIDFGVTYSYFYSGNDNRLIARVAMDRYNCI